MWNLFVQCVSCRGSISFETDSSSFPLCRICFENLVTCPELCNQCGSPLCLTQSPPLCQRPWILRPGVQSYSARYLLLDSTYKILKRWKIQSGIFFDRKILRMTDSLLTTWKKFKPDFIVPVPQRFFRAWKMRGSRAEKLAYWISRETKVPVLQPFLPHPSNFIFQKRQAELKLNERFLNPILFSTQFKNSKKPQRVILVDDFFTTGRTIQQAAQALNSAGVQEIHVFCLGIRLSRMNGKDGETQHTRHLLERNAWPITIAQNQNS